MPWRFLGFSKHSTDMFGRFFSLGRVPNEEIMTSERLEAIEAIKLLKARYFRYMDTKQWDKLRAIFTPDLVADFREAPGDLSNGRDAYMEMLIGAIGPATTVHHGHTPEITLLSDVTAEGVWAMYDIVDHPQFLLEGWGHYHEEYRADSDGNWRIAMLKLTRLKLNFSDKKSLS